jgi:hypothetical protein
MPPKKTSKSPPRAARRRVKRLPPNAAAARDEGPRLLPLDNGVVKEPSRLEHYLELADAALRRKGADENHKQS